MLFAAALTVLLVLSVLLLRSDRRALLAERALHSAEQRLRDETAAAAARHSDMHAALCEGLRAVDLAESQISLAHMQLAAAKSREISLRRANRLLAADARRAEETLGELIAGLSDDDIQRLTIN